MLDHHIIYQNDFNGAVLSPHEASWRLGRAVSFSMAHKKKYIQRISTK